jgi:two-component system response regulator RegX3
MSSAEGVREKATSVLLVEDEESFVDALLIGLGREGFELRVARDGTEALQLFNDEQPDLVLLDLMLPKLSGIDVCRAMRSRSDVPIIIVTAKSTEIDTVLGLELGADDYVTKPYHLRELVARMRAVLRRSPRSQVTEITAETRDAAATPAELPAKHTPAEPARHTPAEPARHTPAERAEAPAEIPVGSSKPEEPLSAKLRDNEDDAVEVGEVKLDRSRHRVYVRGKEVQLRRKEFHLLDILMTNAGRVLTRDVLIDRVWGTDYVGDTKTLDVHVKRLRAHLETVPSSPKIISTVRGVGYRFEIALDNADRARHGD